MKENEVSVLDQYDIDMCTRRIRGAYFMCYKSGAFLYSGL